MGANGLKILQTTTPSRPDDWSVDRFGRENKSVPIFSDPLPAQRGEGWGDGQSYSFFPLAA